MTKPFTPAGGDDGGDRIVDEPLTEALSRRYLAYALSTITSRALPDVRDGLKPVHRRLLFAMRQLKLDPQTTAKKCARVVGDVIGKYHPHGDTAVYDALVRLAQDFAQRYTLIDGQGNFGNIDGDNAAAMRYTECRMTEAAALLLDRPSATTADLVGLVRGPDFPTGGVIVEPRASLLETYETGRGGVRVRATWTEEALPRGGYRIIVTEIPYQVKKADLIEQLADLIENKKAPLLGDVRDESAEDVRVVIEPKTRNIPADVLMESLFKLSALENRFPVNMNVLDAHGTPGVMGLKAALLAFLAHRREVLVRRSRHRLGKIEQRLHILDGMLIAYLNLDEVIRIVRYEDEPKAKLILAFTLSEIQADAILNTRLRQLARLEEMEIRREHAELSEERDGLNALLASEAKQWKLVGLGLREVRKVLGPDTKVGRRRSMFADAPQIDPTSAIEALAPREPITVILSERGWIRAARGKVEDPSELKFKEGDKLAFLVPAETTDKLLIFASDGRFFTLTCDKLPSARGHGEPLRLMLDLDDKVGIADVFAHKPGRKRILGSKAGYGFIMPEDEAIAFRRAGKQVLNGEVAVCLEAVGDHVAVIGDNGKILIFALDELPEMPRGKGVKLQSYREGGLRDAVAFNAADNCTWIDTAGRTRVWAEWREWLGRRAASGKIAPRGFPTSKRFKPK